MKLRIRPALIEDAPALKVFSDHSIGEGYYSVSELVTKLKQSVAKGKMCSFVLVDEDNGRIHGFRLSYPPQNWNAGKGSGLFVEKWGVPIESTAYFQSIFLSPAFTGSGWGPKLSIASIAVLAALGAKAIVTHSWLESPNQSSNKYLSRLGFVTVGLHPNYWYNVDYQCPLCGKPCTCTAEEMILKLEKSNLKADL